MPYVKFNPNVFRLDEKVFTVYSLQLSCNLRAFTYILKIMQKSGAAIVVKITPHTRVTLLITLNLFLYINYVETI